MGMKKRIVYIGLGVVLLLGLFFVAKFTGLIGAEKGLVVDTVRVQRRTLSEYILASGALFPIEELMIAADVAGEVIDVFVEEGEEVKVGQLLAKIRPDNFINALDRQRASLEQARAQLKQAHYALESEEATFTATEQDYLRRKKLFDQRLISEADFQMAESRYVVDRQKLSSAEQQLVFRQHFLSSVQASVDEAKENLRLTSLRSPIDGRITRKLINRGERVVGTRQMTGTTMFQIGKLSDMELRVDVIENEVVRLQIGDSADVVVESFPEQKIRGVVTSIATSSNPKSSAEAVTEYRVKVRLLRHTYEHLIHKTSKRHPLLPGMTASAEIIISTRPNTLSVALSAVTVERSDEDAPYAYGRASQRSIRKKQEIVFVYRDGRVHLRKVKTGIASIDFIEVLEGLREDEVVISGPFLLVSKELEDQQRVSPRDPTKRTRRRRGAKNRSEGLR